MAAVYFNHPEGIPQLSIVNSVPLLLTETAKLIKMIARIQRDLYQFVA